MFRFLNIFSNTSQTVQKSNIRQICILHERYKNYPVDIYNTFHDPLFKLEQINEIISVKSKQRNSSDSNSEFINNDQMIDVLFTSKSPKAPDFLKWSRTVLDKFTKNATTHITYDEIEKTGHVYVLETDGGIKVGKTKDTVQKRIKNLQTGNVNDIKILYDYHTCNQDLLERYVHFILQRYRCNSNREFFDCNVEYIINVIRIAGNVLDTLKSSFETITEEEMFEKMSKKLNTRVPIEQIQTNESEQEVTSESENTHSVDPMDPMDPMDSEDSVDSIISEIISEESEFTASVTTSEIPKCSLYSFLSKNVVYKRGSFLDLSKVCLEYYGKRVSPRTISKKIPIIEYFVKENFTKVNSSCVQIVGNKGWKNLSLK